MPSDGNPSQAIGEGDLVDEAHKAKRRALGIPIHEREEDCTFVDGYCTCGASKRKTGMRRATMRADGRRGQITLDYVEGNEDNR